MCVCVCVFVYMCVKERSCSLGWSGPDFSSIRLGGTLSLRTLSFGVLSVLLPCIVPPLHRHSPFHFLSSDFTFR